MNKKLQTFAKKEIKDGLSQLPKEWQDKFKRMYSPLDPKLDIDNVVANMHDSVLDIAMEQIEHSILKNAKQNNPRKCIECGSISVITVDEHEDRCTNCNERWHGG